MDTGEMPRPTQTAAIRRRSVSKQAQQSLPGFRMIPRGVRLSAGESWASFRASNTEEKNGKLVSTKSAQIGCFPARSVDVSAAGDTVAETNKPRANKPSGAHDRFRREGRHSIPWEFIDRTTPVFVHAPSGDGEQTCQASTATFNHTGTLRNRFIRVGL